MNPDPHRCIVCGTALPEMTRKVALEKGAAAEVQVDNGPKRTFYRCIGRHTPEEFLQAIGLVPKFVRASKAGGNR
jgi:hypothetical protein